MLPKHTSLTVLEHLPATFAELPEWFQTLSDDDFDCVCCSAITCLITESYVEGDPATVREITQALTGMRDRYRMMKTTRAPLPKPAPSRVYSKKLNEIIVRIIRRVQGVTLTELGRIWGVCPQTVWEIRHRKTWSHVA